MTRPPRPRPLVRGLARTAVAAVVTAVLGALLVSGPAQPAAASSTVSTSLSTGLSTGSTATSPGTDVTAGVVSAAGSAVTTAAAAVRVHIDQYDGIASPDKPLVLNGHIDATPMTGLSAYVSVMSGGVGSRGTLAKLRADPTLGGKARYVLAPNSSGTPVVGTAFSINQKLKIEKPLTIYAMKITIAPTGGPSKVLGAAYSFLVWSPEQPGLKATSLATVLPISDYPRLRSDNILTDNQLATEVRPGGRLYKLLIAVSPTSRQPSPIALAVDPTLLKELQLMSGPYSYADTEGPKSKPPDRYAGDYLAALRIFAATPGNVVFALPWGDADIAALVRAGGQHDDGQLNDALWAINTGQQTLRDVLGVANPPPVAYPGDGLANAATLEFLAHPTVGVTTAILDDRLLPATSKAASSTPTALTVQQTANGPIRALAADSRLATLLTPKISQNGLSKDQALADVLADVAMITAEQPSASASRLAVLALPRLWDPTDDWASLVLHSLSTPADPGYQPFFQPVPLPVAPKGGAGTTASIGQAATLTFAPAGSSRTYVYPDSATATEIPTSYVDAVEHLRAEVRELDPVLCATTARNGKTTNPPAPAPCALTDVVDAAGSKPQDGRATVINPMLNTLLTALSVDWRPDRSGAVRLSQEVDGRISQIRANVEVVASQKVTLTSRNGAVPLSVQNISDQQGGGGYPMTVILSLSSNDKTRLRSAARMALTVAPGAKTQVEISVSSDAAGTFPVFVQVLTPDGQRLSAQPVRILVRSTAYGSIATAITYVTIGLFVAAVVLRQVRRSRRKRRDGGDSGGSAGPVAGVTPTGPNTAAATDRATVPIRRIQANAAGTQRTEVERAYAGGVPANPSEP
ncbi:DUF6049 family protein [Pseudofrankia sp. DC12]|uniref:DUF6049 family protein n=1 Tax=Pseudofrankia sp. DC12 TaxID=683315 RepID=UPI000A543232|nr:DUF6049 family protein [Pseudofrankia sp. DC12]